MAIDRRTLLAGVAGLVAGPRAAFAAGAGGEGPRLAAAFRRPGGGYGAAILDDEGRVLRSVVLPGRGHDATFCPLTGLCVVFARRPGTFALAFDAAGHRPPAVLKTPDDRHFYGHGVFSRDGRTLYTTENDFEAGRGVVGVYDVTRRFARTGELSSHGLGPHDLALLADGSTLVVANGGFREHPDFGAGRRVLNPDGVETSLAYIDVRTGELLERHPLPAASGLSLRHLAVVDGDTVLVAAQVHDPTAYVPGAPLVFRHRRRSVPQALALALPPAANLAGYVSSVAVDRAGTLAAVTSSRGGLVVVFEIASGRVVRVEHAPDVSGVAPGTDAAPGRFATSAGDGQLRLDAHAGRRHVRAAWHWDNHLVCG